MQFEADNKDVKIDSLEDFCEALKVLLSDPSFPEENISTVRFVEAMRAWLEAFKARNNLFDQPSDEYITWSDLYKLLQAASVYE